MRKALCAVLVAVLNIVATPVYAKLNDSPSLSTRQPPEYPPLVVGPTALFAAQAMDCAFTDMFRGQKEPPTPETKAEIGIILRDTVKNFGVYKTVEDSVPEIAISAGHKVVIVFPEGVCGVTHLPVEIADVLRLSTAGLNGESHPAWGYTEYNDQLIFIVWLGLSKEGRPMFIFFTVPLPEGTDGMAKKELGRP